MELAYTFDSSCFRLGSLCKRGHEWCQTGQSLRRTSVGGGCIECEKMHAIIRTKSGKRKRQRADRCQRLRRQGLTARGTVPLRIDGAVCKGERNEAIALELALQRATRNSGRLPSVARLVMDEQRRYWRENPEAKREHDRQWARASWWLEYQTRPDLRLYVRQKSKRRKALLRKQTAHQIPAKQLRLRFAQFDNCCAYCGASGDMQIEHVVPISKGGTHAIGNIVPACQTCNFSKRDHEVEQWYRMQSEFSEKRWRRICRILGWDRSAVGQLALL